MELRQGRRKANPLAEVCRSVVLQASTNFITRKIGKYESKNANRRTPARVSRKVNGLQSPVPAGKVADDGERREETRHGDQVAAGAGQLKDSSAKNISALLRGASSALYQEVVMELIADEGWDELNDRFYKTLAFGTGGLRGRTIGRIVTKAERGSAREDQPPEFPCVGTNAMNFLQRQPRDAGTRCLSAANGARQNGSSARRKS